MVGAATFGVAISPPGSCASTAQSLQYRTPRLPPKQRAAKGRADKLSRPWKAPGLQPAEEVDSRRILRSVGAEYAPPGRWFYCRGRCQALRFGYAARCDPSGNSASCTWAWV